MLSVRDVEIGQPTFDPLQLKAAFLKALSPHIAAGQPVVLLDFPAYPNVGDSAIWLGELDALTALGAGRLAFTCTPADYDPMALRVAAPEGPIFLSGGGNFGDLWLDHQELRERVCQDFPDRPIVQLPQSVHFDDPVRLDAARRIIGGHGAFTMMVRDRQSLARMIDFGCPVSLVPDAAFVLGPLDIGIAPTFAQVALLRTDKEACDQSALIEALPVATRRTDWLDEDGTALQALEMYVRGRDGLATARQRTAEIRLIRGLEILSSGARVVTDRLHAHILSLLLGRPHFIFDNSYGKLSSYLEAWTSTSPLVTVGQSAAELERFLAAPVARG